MRPAGECHIALVKAAQAIKIERAQSGQGATLLELVHRSQVGYAVARFLVPNLKRWGHLQVVGQRKVAGRNRPAFEYGPVNAAPDLAGSSSMSALDACLKTWTR